MSSDDRLPQPNRPHGGPVGNNRLDTLRQACRTAIEAYRTAPAASRPAMMIAIARLQDQIGRALRNRVTPAGTVCPFAWVDTWRPERD